MCLPSINVMSLPLNIYSSERCTLDHKTKEPNHSRDNTKAKTWSLGVTSRYEWRV